MIRSYSARAGLTIRSYSARASLTIRSYSFHAGLSTRSYSINASCFIFSSSASAAFNCSLLPILNLLTCAAAYIVLRAYFQVERRVTSTCPCPALNPPRDLDHAIRRLSRIHTTEQYTIMYPAVTGYCTHTPQCALVLHGLISFGRRLRLRIMSRYYNCTSTLPMQQNVCFVPFPRTHSLYHRRVNCQGKFYVQIYTFQCKI